MEAEGTENNMWQEEGELRQCVFFVSQYMSVIKS